MSEVGSSKATTTTEAKESTIPINTAKSKKRALRIAGLIFLVLISVLVGAGIYWVLQNYVFDKSSKAEGTNSTSAALVMNNAKNLRLPKFAVPESYNITVKVYLPGYEANFPESKNMTFDGNVKIRILVKKPTKRIVLNSMDIKIIEANVTLSNGKAVEVKCISKKEEYEKLIIVLAEEIKQGHVELELNYVGKINNDLKGLYQSWYTNARNERKAAAVTHFEAPNARRFVPCFDEPEYKATWKVNVIHPAGTSAISNGMESKPIGMGNNFLSTSFKESPRMSSYLQAIFVSDFVHEEMEFSHGKKIRVWSRPEAKNMTRFALEAGAKVTKFYEELYGIEFPLEKQDMVALPDFAAGAMENWGLITYRENRLLYDPKLYSIEQKADVAAVIAHELAHMWFGNLVTMKWWDDLWLNEGFARHVQTIGQDHISPHLGGADNAGINTRENGLLADALATSHPLSSKADTIEEIMASFDSISYDKGASVIRMIKFIMTEEQFNKGLQDYLKKHSYNNTVSLDLWTAMDRHVLEKTKGPDGKKFNVTDFALQWTTQMGFPMVSLASADQKQFLTIDSQRFKKSNETKELQKYANPEYGFKWDVPVWYQIEGEDEEKFVWLPRGQTSSLPKTSKAVIINSSKGFYRSAYCPTTLSAITNALKKNGKVFPVHTKVAFISDIFQMTSIGKAKYDVIFELLEYGKKETEYQPMKAILSGLAGINTHFGTEPELVFYKETLLKFLTEKYDAYDGKLIEFIAKTDGDETKRNEHLLAREILSNVCYAGHSGCIESRNKLFKEQVIEKCTKSADMASKCSTVTAGLRASVYCHGVKYGSEEAFEKVMTLYQRETDAAEKSSLMAALTCTQDVTTIKSLVALVFDRNSTVFRLQDSIYKVFLPIANHPVGREFVANYFMEHWDKIYVDFKDSSFINLIISGSLKHARNQLELKQVKHFISSAAHTDKYFSFTKAIENIEYQLKWKEEHFENVAGLFNQYVHGNQKKMW